MSQHDKTASAEPDFLKLITSPAVRPFLSIEKVVKSESFLQLIRYCDEHFSRHRDTARFEKLLNMLDGTKYRDVLADYLKRRHGVQVSRDHGRLKVSVPKDTSSSVKPRGSLDFEKHLALKPTQRPKTQPLKQPGSASVRAKADYIDALDHPARLPGSFGHGKRR